MPNSGTPEVYSSGSTDGAPSTCTDAGPPERMIAFGFIAAISANDIVRGTISEYTCASRTRRAISCAYCAPRSTTRTGRGSLMLGTLPAFSQHPEDDVEPAGTALRRNRKQQRVDPGIGSAPIEIQPVPDHQGVLRRDIDPRQRRREHPCIRL